jgi:PhnB protein
MPVHLCFDGRCEEAFLFYQRVLGGRLNTVKYGERGPQTMREKILHATLETSSETVLGADVAPEGYQRPSGFFVLIERPDAERVFAALAEGGEVKMPLQKTFWAEKFGVLVDQFGVPWEVTS